MTSRTEPTPAAPAAPAAAPGAAPAPPAPAVEVRPYRPGDEGPIIDLYERTFGRPMGRSGSATHWRWEFMDTPADRRAILLAWSGPVLAAQYAVLPLRVEVNGAPRLAALSLDTATDAAFRGRGLFPKLARALYADLAAQGYAAVFGFPNAQSAPGFFQKLGWTELAPFPLFVKPLRHAIRDQCARRGGWRAALAPLAEALGAPLRRAPRSLPAGIAVEPLRALGDEADALWERARHGRRMGVVRDRAYLQWRYLDCPDVTYDVWGAREGGRLAGIAVTHVTERFGTVAGFVMDVVAEEARPDVADALLSACETAMAGQGARILTALAYPGTAVHGALRRAGFLRPPRALMPQEIHFGVCPLDPALGALREPAGWTIGWGDSDVV